MKIETPAVGRSAATTRKTDKAKVKTDEFARALEDEDEVASTAAVSGAPAISAIEALISVQEMSGEDERGAQAKARGEELLERLDALRHGLLAGQLSADKLDALVALVKSERAETSDPGLAETLEQIELLARVELAKLGRDV
ncbi:MAG: flagellar assembly protein FliX [Proteobacteria bacterium]|nr:flagellar assembly protein FliX [Pseudomonadota bacterium]